MFARYPNLELIAYKVMLYYKNCFGKDILESNLDFEMFPQIWGSTCTAFDECKDGSPAVGGCAMTKAYTVLVYDGEHCWVFIGNDLCYRVDAPFTQTFLEDVSRKCIKGLRESKKYY